MIYANRASQFVPIGYDLERWRSLILQQKNDMIKVQGGRNV